MLKTVATDSVNACKLDLVSSSLERFRLTLDAIKAAVILDRQLPDDPVYAACGATSDWRIVVDVLPNRIFVPHVRPSSKLRNGSGFDKNTTKTPGLIAGRSSEAMLSN